MTQLNRMKDGAKAGVQADQEVEGMDVQKQFSMVGESSGEVPFLQPEFTARLGLSCASGLQQPPSCSVNAVVSSSAFLHPVLSVPGPAYRLSHHGFFTLTSLKEISNTSPVLMNCVLALISF